MSTAPDVERVEADAVDGVFAATAAALWTSAAFFGVSGIS
jgi:hypothetical protein